MRLLIVLVCAYALFTAAAGYQRGQSAGQFYGNTRLGEIAAADGSPDWENVSPTFWFGIDAGLAK